ncbi:hypothetical protein EP073_13515 [Geovibrio thiophilus]|uniref:Carboxypeptidase regulatory-like domain-containing protein n=1 Tax=Geovibrio thiophilus TaxID=139438 RepID=A0A410K1W0_9BACT|nr:hypothetical protein [Geovibrio thiophilus]QAR34382.1 hypothetical protein EP073_13515 [Geovibrio thiophilus]
MKFFLLLFAVLFAMTGAAEAKLKLDETVKAFFPKPAKLTGGEERWLGTGITETKTGNGFVYTSSYSYYSPDVQQIMNIKRKKTFDVKASIHAYSNYVTAFDKYEDLAKKAPKGKVQEIGFGDKGVFYYIPKSAYINDADFTIVFLNKIFVAEIQADDGFALMDAAAHINANIQRFILSNIEFFLVRNISLSVTAKGFERSSDILGFTEEEPKEVTVTGRVFSEDSKPLANAEVAFLETGKSIKTAADGSYKYSVKMGGRKNVSIAKNFYLKEIKQDKAAAPSVEDGVFTVNTFKTDGSQEPGSVWKLAFYGNTVHGKALMGEEGKQRLYPLKGTYENGRLTLNLDCRAGGSSFKCTRNFEGTLASDSVSGTWTGTGGGGSWKLALNSYSEITDYIYLNEDNSELSRFVKQGGRARTEKGALTISVNDEKTTGILFSLKKDRPEFNEVFIKSASLVLTHVPQQQSGSMRLFRYITETADGTVIPVPATMSYSGDAVMKPESYEIEADVTDYLFSSARSGVLVAPILQGGASAGSHTFAGHNVKPAAYAPKLKTIRYVPSDEADRIAPVAVRIKNLRGRDVVGDKNVVKSDGEPDTVFEAVFRLPGKTITSMEIYGEGTVTRKRNTDPLDIYPVIGFIKNGIPMNDIRGGVKLLLEQTSEKFDLHIAPIKETEPDKLKYRIVISGEVFEGTVEKQ